MSRVKKWLMKIFPKHIHGYTTKGNVDRRFKGFTIAKFLNRKKK